MRNLIEAIIRISNAASTDPARYHIQGVAIDLQGDAFRLRATDGRIFTEDLLPLETLNNPPKTFKECIISLEDIKKLKLLLKSAGKLGAAFELHQTVESISRTLLRFTYGDPAKPTSFCDIVCLDAEYPKTDQLKVKPEDRPYEVALNPELLLKLYKALKDTRNEHVTLKLPKKPGTLQSIVVECGFNQGLIMPCRIDSSKV